MDDQRQTTGNTSFSMNANVEAKLAKNNHKPESPLLMQKHQRIEIRCSSTPVAHEEEKQEPATTNSPSGALTPPSSVQNARSSSLSMFNTAADWFPATFSCEDEGGGASGQLPSPFSCEDEVGQIRSPFSCEDEDGQLRSPFSCENEVGQLRSPFSTTSLLSAMGHNDDDDDDDSTTSTAYYDPSDLNPSNWIKAMDAPTFGFAVVALTTAVTHPLLFLAGALTAFGAARAAGAGYDFFMDGSVGRWFCWSSNALTEDSTTAISSKQQITGDNDESTADDSNSTSSEAAEPELSAAVANEAPLIVHTAEHDEIADKKWLELHYPRLDDEVLKNQDFFGLNAVEFFEVFFADQAPYNFVEFQKKRGDTDIEYGLWKDLKNRRILSLHPLADKDVPTNIENCVFQERHLTFKAKTNAVFGPPYARTTKTQRILIISKRLAVLESKTVLSDISFSDRFFVMDRWLIRAAKDNKDRYTSRVSSSCQVIFTQPCPFEYQIRTKTCSALTDVASAWCVMAQEALKLAEQAKLDRLRHDNDVIPDEPQADSVSEENLDESIEVEHDNINAVELARCDSDPAQQRRLPLRNFRRSLSQMRRDAMRSRKASM